MTLRRGVEEKLRERIAWFEEIVAHDPEPEPPVAGGLPMVQVDPRARAPASGGGELLQIAHLKRPFRDQADGA